MGRNSKNQGKRTGSSRFDDVIAAPSFRVSLGVITLALVMILPGQVLADPGNGNGTSASTTTTTPSTTTTTPTSTTTTTTPTSTTTTDPSTTTTTDPSTTTTTDPSTTTTTTPTSTTTTIPSASTTTTLSPTSTTTAPLPSTTTTLSDAAEEDPGGEEEELLPAPAISFPIVGQVSYADTFDAPRDGGMREHKGTDILAEKGAPVVAVAHGVVVRLGESPLAGQYVVVRHSDGWQSAYVHLNNDSPATDNGLASGFASGIDVGVRVRPGTLLGYVGDSGNAEDTTPHLHFELHQPDGLKVNPYEPLRRARKVTEIHRVPVVEYGEVVATNTSLTSHVSLDGGFNSVLNVHNDHAYIGTWGNQDRCPGSGVRVVDVSDPAAPLVISSFADHSIFPDTYISEVWVGAIDVDDEDRDIAVVGLAPCVPDPAARVGGIALFDVTEPGEASLISTMGVGGSAGGVSHLDVIEANGSVKVVASVPGSFQASGGSVGDVRIYDISEPTSPTVTSDWQPASEAAFVPALALEGDLASPDPVTGVLWVDANTFAAGTSGENILLVANTDSGPSLSQSIRIVSDAVSPSPATGTQPLAVIGSEILIGQVTFDQDRSVETRAHYLAEPAGSQSPVVVTSVVQDPTRALPPDALGSVAYGTSSIVTSSPENGVAVIDTSGGAGSVTAEFIPAPSTDPQWFWVDGSGSRRSTLTWDVAKSDGYIFLTDHNSGLWVFTIDPTDPVEMPDLTAR